VKLYGTDNRCRTGLMVGIPVQSHERNRCFTGSAERRYFYFLNTIRLSEKEEEYSSVYDDGAKRRRRRIKAVAGFTVGDRYSTEKILNF